MFIKADKVALRNAFKDKAYAGNVPAVRVSSSPTGTGFCLLVTVKDTRARGRVKKVVKALELESEIEFRVRG
jgi:hypothetical protein